MESFHTNTLEITVG